MRPPVTHQPVQPPQPPRSMSLDDDSLPPPQEMVIDDPRGFDRMTDMAGDLAPIVDWPEFPDDSPPLQERRRR